MALSNLVTVRFRTMDSSSRPWIRSSSRRRPTRLRKNRTEGYFETHDGHRLRYAVFRSSAPVAKGTVVILQGRNEYIEKYFETIRDLTDKASGSRPSTCADRAARRGS